MWIPAMAGCRSRSTFPAHAEKDSGDEVMSVGRNRVTPVARRAAMALWSSDSVVRGWLKSTPANPFTCKSKKPGNFTWTGADWVFGVGDDLARSIAIPPTWLILWSVAK